MAHTISQTFYWDEVMNYSNNNDNIYNQPEWKCVKGDQDSIKHQNSNTYHWCCNHNYGKGMWVVQLPEECKYSETPDTWFQKPAKYENDNQTVEWGDCHLTLSDNLHASLMSNIQLSKNEVDQLISV